MVRGARHMISFIANTYPVCSLCMDPSWLPYSTDCAQWQILENTVGNIDPVLSSTNLVAHLATVHLRWLIIKRGVHFPEAVHLGGCCWELMTSLVSCQHDIFRGCAGNISYLERGSGIDKYQAMNQLVQRREVIRYQSCQISILAQIHLLTKFCPR